MLMNMMLLFLMSWVQSAYSMVTDIQLKIDFCVVAKQLGFDVEKLHIFKNIAGTECFTQQIFGTGWKSIRMNSNGLFKIGGCAYDNGALKEGYYQTDWISMNKALVYEPDGQ